MECTAEIDGNEINLAQMWSLFCLWEFETSLQSFKFPCNLEVKEISKCVCLPCQWPSIPYCGPVEQNSKCEQLCMKLVCERTLSEFLFKRYITQIKISHKIMYFFCRLPIRLVTMSWLRRLSLQFGIILLLHHITMNNLLFV